MRHLSWKLVVGEGSFLGFGLVDFVACSWVAFAVVVGSLL